jgi:hypothetical protein
MSTGEPRNITLADLMVLVAGFAVGMTPAGLYGSIPQAPTFSSRSPLWLVALWDFSISIILMGGAIGIVAIVRRLRYGGRFSPGEFVAVAYCLGLLHYGTQLLCRLLAKAVDADPFAWYYLAILGHGIVIALACAGVVCGRRRWPVWVTGLCLAAAWSELRYGSSMASGRISMTPGLHHVWNLTALLALPVTSVLGLLVSWAILLVLAVLGQLERPLPLVVALRSPTRGSRSLPWTDAAGLYVCLLGWALSIVGMLASLIVDAGSRGISWSISTGVLIVVLEVVVWVVSYVLVRRFGAAFARWWIPESTTPAETSSGPDPYAAPAS